MGSDLTKRVSVSPLVAARLGFTAGLVAGSVGVFLAWGLAVALMVAGALTSIACLLLVETGPTDADAR